MFEVDDRKGENWEFLTKTLKKFLNLLKFYSQLPAFGDNPSLPPWDEHQNWWGEHEVTSGKSREKKSQL